MLLTEVFTIRLICLAFQIPRICVEGNWSQIGAPSHSLFTSCYTPSTQLSSFCFSGFIQNLKDSFCPYSCIGTWGVFWVLFSCNYQLKPFLCSWGVILGSCWLQLWFVIWWSYLCLILDFDIKACLLQIFYFLFLIMFLESCWPHLCA